MTRTELAEHIQKRYGAEAEFPWVKYPNFMVFRRNDNKKWFAVVMDLSGRKLGLPSDEVIDVMNLKCDHILLGSLRTAPGFYPAYHMNKANWVTVALDGSVSCGEIEWLLEMSYDLTAPKRLGKQKIDRTML